MQYSISTTNPQDMVALKCKNRWTRSVNHLNASFSATQNGTETKIKTISDRDKSKSSRVFPSAKIPAPQHALLRCISKSMSFCRRSYAHQNHNSSNAHRLATNFIEKISAAHLHSLLEESSWRSTTRSARLFHYHGRLPQPCNANVTRIPLECRRFQFSSGSATSMTPLVYPCLYCYISTCADKIA